MLCYVILVFSLVYVAKQLHDVLQMYAMLERVSPRTRKLELFARMHNVQAGYVFFIPVRLSFECANFCHCR